MNTYGTLTLLGPPVTSPVTANFVEPLTLAEVKAYLNLPERSPVDDEEDALIEGLITAAREEAETQQGRDLVQKRYRLSLDYWTCGEIALRAPLASVESVTYRDSDDVTTTLTEGTDYIVDTTKHPGLIMPPYGESWPSFTPWPSSAVSIDFTSGFDSEAAFWSDAGARIRIGMKMLANEWFNNRLPLSYDLAAGGTGIVNRINALLSSGSLTRVR